MTDPIQQAYATPTAAARMRFVIQYLVDSVLLAAVLSLVLAFIELLIVSTDVHWLGGTPTQWRETGVTLSVYTAMIALPTFLIAVFIRLVTRHDWIDDYVPVVAASLSAAGLWLVLRRFSPEQVTLQLDVTVLMSFAIGAVVAVVMIRVGMIRIRPFSVQAVAAFAGAIAVLRYSTVVLALDPSRTELAPSFALGWLAVLAVVTVGFNALFRGRDVAWQATVALVATSFTLPGLLYAIPSMRAGDGSPDKPNLLLITADTLRADDSSVYGGPVAMPALESLASDGVVVDRFYTTAPWTVPSLSSLFSGRFPVSLTPGLAPDVREAEETTLHRLYSYWRGASGPTLVAGMRNRGYRTMAVVANPAMHTHQWLWQDFDSYQLVNAADTEAYGPYTQSPLFRNALDELRPGTVQERPFDSTRRVVQYAKTLIKNQTDEPFFLWVHFMDPHSPYDPPPTLRVEHDRWSMFPPSQEESAAEPDWPYDMTPDEKAYARAQYRAETAYIDSAVGDVLGALEATGKTESTYVCFLSDHGEEFWDHDRWGHGQTLFEEQIHVPFVIAGPRVGEGRIQGPISAIDFAPTIANLLGLSANTGWHGQSFAAPLRKPAEANSSRPIFAQSTQHAMYQEEPLQMVMDDQLKYVRSLESSFRGLYDLATDPTEQTNLIKDRPEDAERLHQMLETWSESFPSTYQQSLGTSGTLETDPEVLETLKAIGYGAE